jgi:MFS family permease
MAWMFVFGLGNLMIGAPQAIFLEDRLGASYLQAILATTIIPLMTMPIIIPVWARLLDRVHIVKFRSIHGWSFVTAAGVMWLAAWTESLWLFYVSGAMLGVGFAGGSIAWNIGHQDFASPERDALYMSVHVTLNGIRGVIAPFAAVALYKWLNASGVSHLTFAVCFAVNIVGAAGFAWQWRGIRCVHTAPRPRSDERSCVAAARVTGGSPASCGHAGDQAAKAPLPRDESQAA